MIHNLNFDAVVLANGDFPTASIPLNILKGASYIACCDGAVIRLDKCGLTPNVIVGDCDSIPASLKSKYSAILHRVEEQETNDLTKTITYLQSTGKKRIAIVGATGKREDHTLGNISLLTEYMQSGLQVVMFTDYGYFAACSGTAEFKSKPGQQISVFSFGAKNFRAEGLVYPLHDFTSLWQGTLNECNSETFTIHADGNYILFVNYFE
ncbi:MAG: thiamine diphosphokinase [Bacteroidaceae bacterium]|nr:thiamine diphosphokinase [Bacteroidaceae bacterium]